MDRALMHAAQPQPASELHWSELVSALNATPELIRIADEQQSRMTRERMTTLVGAVHEPLVVIGSDEEVIAATDSWLRLMEYQGPATGAPIEPMCKWRFGADAARSLVHVVRQASSQGTPQSTDLPTEPGQGLVGVTCTPVLRPLVGDVEEMVVRFEVDAPIGAPRGEVPRGVGALTSREQDVLVALADGLSTPDVADRLGIRENTVRGHIKALLHKLHAHTQLQAVLAGMRTGLVPHPSDVRDGQTSHSR